MSTWKNILTNANSNYSASKINSITFSKTIPAGFSLSQGISVAAQSNEGTKLRVKNDANSARVLAFVSPASTSGLYDVTFFSNATIYTPAYSDFLFAKLTTVVNFNFDNLSFKYATSVKGSTMESMFNQCEKLENISLTIEASIYERYLVGLFSGCSALKNVEINLIGGKSYPINFDKTFDYCSQITSFSIKDLDGTSYTAAAGLSAVSNISKVLTYLDLSGVWTTNLPSFTNVQTIVVPAHLESSFGSIPLGAEFICEENRNTYTQIDYTTNGLTLKRKTT